MKTTKYITQPHNLSKITDKNVTILFLDIIQDIDILKSIIGNLLNKVELLQKTIVGLPDLDANILKHELEKE